MALGTAYGAVMRRIFDNTPSSDAAAWLAGGMSIAFLFVVPFALGALTAAFAPVKQAWAYRILMPLVSCGLLMVTVIAMAWEGVLCIIMASPLYFGMAILGAVTVGVIAEVRKKRVPPPMVMSALVLPLAVAPMEARFAPASETRTVETDVFIAADPATVWTQVVRVPRLHAEEQRTSFFHRIGIPRPLEATLSHDGVGGIREASFEGGVRFHERITEWEAERRLGFDIEADVASISPDILDRHVRVGGEYFDVFHGRFDLEPAPGGTRLRLSSHHRLSTRFNGYAGLWTDAVMRDVQSHICRVIQKRSEDTAARSVR